MLMEWKINGLLNEEEVRRVLALLWARIRCKLEKDMGLLHKEIILGRRQDRKGLVEECTCNRKIGKKGGIQEQNR